MNGALVGTKTTSGSIATTNLPLHIGGNSGLGEWFQGRLDDIRVYNRPLTVAEIQTDMNTAVGPGAPPPPPPPADQVGSWTPPTSMPIVAVHTTLLPNGRVSMWSGALEEPGSEMVWDPATETFESTPTTRNLFCVVTVKLADGRLAAFGGHATNFNGIKDVNLYDYRTKTWRRGADMSRGRWYPSATVLSDGRVLVLSGDQFITQPSQPEGPLRHPSSTLPEIYDPTADRWTTLPNAARVMPYYPQMFLLPDGRIFDAGPDTTTRTLNVATGTWSTVGTSPIGGHSAVMYRPGKVLKSGTWADPEFPNLAVTNRAAVIDMTAASPAWRETSPMANPRSYHNLIALPDGKVLAIAGDTTSRGVDPSSGVLEPEIWDPATEVWTPMAHHQISRMYHQTSLLLPDGRVLLSGSGANLQGPDERSYQLFSPPYLHKGPRPSISGAPGVVRYGTPFTIDTPDAARIASVSLVRMGSETHSVDQDQRFMSLNFTRGSGALTVDAPANGNLAPPGWYMVFLVDDQGVPSVASIVQVPVGSGDVTPPSAPANLTATGQLGGVQLNWSASTDNVGVTEYRVHRSTTAGFTPNTANRIATVVGGTTTHTDSGLAAGTYHYVVVAADAAGNTASSAQASGTALADTTAPTVSLTSPAAGSTVSGVASVAATASDNVGVQSVQFKLDGANLGAPDTTAPYGANWDTRSASNGSHSLAVMAVDAAGNQTTSTAVSVIVDNPAGSAGLVAAYGFEEASGTTTADQTGLGHTGTPLRPDPLDTRQVRARAQLRRRQDGSRSPTQTTST